MIYSKDELLYFLQEDAKANGRKSIRPRFFGDDIWKFIIAYRKKDYYSNIKNRFKSILILPFKLFYNYRFSVLSHRLCFSIASFNIGPGLCLVHYGSIVIGDNAIIGSNCRIQEGVTIGATNGSSKSATIGNNVFIGTGAKIIGDICIANDVAIGANAVVCKSVEEPGTTWGGVPAKKIGDNNSHSNLSSLLGLLD